jgi:hypothetical protein
MTPTRMIPKGLIPIHIIMKLSKVQNRENIESCRRKVTHGGQESSDEIISRFLSRNSAGQKEVR